MIVHNNMINDNNMVIDYESINKSSNLGFNKEGIISNFVNCWHIKRRDGEVIGFTEYDQDLVIDGIKYLARSGANSSAAITSVGCSVDNMDITCALSSDLLDDDDIIAGKYDYAEVCSFIVDYRYHCSSYGNLFENSKNFYDQGSDKVCINCGKMALKRGWIGEIELNGSSFIAEVRGLTQNFSANVGEVYSPLCRAKFGDEHCSLMTDDCVIENMKVSNILGVARIFSEDFGNYMDNFSERICIGHFFPAMTRGYENIENEGGKNIREFSSSRIDPERFLSILELRKILSNGYIIFKTGKNIGLKFAIKSMGNDGEITLFSPPINRVEVGDEFDIYGGCDKSFGMCSKVFGNAVNFRGEPHVPVANNMMQVVESNY